MPWVTTGRTIDFGSGLMAQIAHPALGYLQHTTKCVLIVSLDEDIISPLLSRIRQTTSLCALNVAPDGNKAGDSARLRSSPLRGGDQRDSRLSASGSSLSAPDFVARLISAANIATILIDLRGHDNELGLSCAFLAALQTSGFNGHLIYISITGELLSQNEPSRKLREANPIHAAIEMQLRDTFSRGGQRGAFAWTILGRAALDTPLPGSTKIREPSAGEGNSPASTSGDDATASKKSQLSRQNSRTSTESERASATDIVEGIMRAIQDQGLGWSGRKIMLETQSGRRVSFMNQTDWVSETTE